MRRLTMEEVLARCKVDAKVDAVEECGRCVGPANDCCSWQCRYYASMHSAKQLEQAKNPPEQKNYRTIREWLGPVGSKKMDDKQFNITQEVA